MKPHTFQLMVLPGAQSNASIRHLLIHWVVKREFSSTAAKKTFSFPSGYGRWHCMKIINIILYGQQLFGFHVSSWQWQRLWSRGQSWCWRSLRSKWWLSRTQSGTWLREERLVEFHSAYPSSLSVVIITHCRHHYHHCHRHQHDRTWSFSVIIIMIFIFSSSSINTTTTLFWDSCQTSKVKPSTCTGPPNTPLCQIGLRCFLCPFNRTTLRMWAMCGRCAGIRPSWTTGQRGGC